MTLADVVTRPDVMVYVASVLVLGGVIVGLFDYVTRRIVLRRSRVLFTVLPRQGRVIEHAPKEWRT